MEIIRMKLFNKSTLLALFFLILPFNAQGQDNAWNNYTLEGIGGVFVRTSTNAACELAGINTNETQAVVERTLLESEVELLTEQEMLRNSALPELRVSSQCLVNQGTVAYFISVRMHQSIQMTRDAQITLAEGVTWYSTGMGIGEVSDLQTSISETVQEEIKNFSAAYLEANPSETEGSPQNN
jgi:hypothetical protein